MGVVVIIVIVIIATAANVQGDFLSVRHFTLQA